MDAASKASKMPEFSLEHPTTLRTCTHAHTHAHTHTHTHTSGENQCARQRDGSTSTLHSTETLQCSTCNVARAIHDHTPHSHAGIAGAWDQSVCVRTRINSQQIKPSSSSSVASSSSSSSSPVFGEQAHQPRNPAPRIRQHVGCQHAIMNSERTTRGLGVRV
jgi:hypothetical protein